MEDQNRLGHALLMEDMTSREIAEAVRSGMRTAIIPLGSIEAHGHHLPINTDTIVAQHLACLIAERLGSALVAHAMPLGYAPRTTFHGSISVPVTVIVKVLTSYCAALERDGFKKIVLLPMHAEHFQTLSLFAPDLGREFPKLTIIPSVDVGTLLALRNEIAAEHDVSPDEAGWHAGAAETAEMLAINPTKVRKATLEPGYLGPSGFARILPETLRDGWTVLDERGVMGDPRKATEEMGAKILESLADYLAEEIRKARMAPSGPPHILGPVESPK